MARKRRLGPYGAAAEEGGDPLGARKAREKAVAAMLRAGHQYDHVRFVLGAASPDDIEEWLGEAADEEGVQDQ